MTRFLSQRAQHADSDSASSPPPFLCADARLSDAFLLATSYLLQSCFLPPSHLLSDISP